MKSSSVHGTEASSLKQKELIYNKLTYKLLQYVSYKLISVLRATEEG